MFLPHNKRKAHLIIDKFRLSHKVLTIKAIKSDCNLFHKTITKETALENPTNPIKIK